MSPDDSELRPGRGQGEVVDDIGVASFSQIGNWRRSDGSGPVGLGLGQ